MKKFLSAIILCTFPKLAAAGQLLKFINGAKKGKRWRIYQQWWTHLPNTFGMLAWLRLYRSRWVSANPWENSVNWIGIAPTAEDYGKAIEWLRLHLKGSVRRVIPVCIHMRRFVYDIHLPAPQDRQDNKLRDQQWKNTSSGHDCCFHCSA